MPSLANHQSGQTTKMILIGDSGTAKSGALASLAIEGYNIRVIDFDNGLDVLANLLKPNVPPYNLTPEKSAEAIARIRYVTCTDKMRVSGVNFVPVQATAWTKAIKNLENFDGELGNIGTWGPQDIIVIDSLNYAGRAAMRLISHLNNRLGQAPWQSDYLEAQRLVDGLLSMLFSDAVSCNVIVLSHIKEVGKKEQKLDAKGNVITFTDPDTLKGYAETGTGNALSPTVGRSFNAMLMTDITGQGQATRRIIRTQPYRNIALKCPVKLPDTLPVETGLATYFKAVRSA